MINEKTHKLFTESQVLIIDDIPENLQVLGSMLHNKGMKIAVALNGKQGLATAAKILPDLILLDITMPEMDGFTVCTELKKDPATADIPVIFLTALNSTEEITRGFELGGVDYITKPYNSNELIVRVKTHLELRNAMKEIASANAELKKANENKDKFLVTLSHDLRSPFSGLLGLSDILVNEHGAMEAAEMLECLQLMNLSLKTQYEFIENLLEWGKLVRGRMNFRPELFNFNELVKQKEILLSNTFKKKDQKFTNMLPEALDVFADRNTLSSVIHNLITNASKFTFDGGEIRVLHKEENGRVIIEVRDNGRGMSAENKEKLFKIEEIHTTPGTNKEPGSGFGLILCMEMVHLNKGEIWVESEEGKGSSFFVSLPASGVQEA